MSEDRSRFKIRKGEIEIEYEGKSTEANARYKEAFEWIKTITISPPEGRPPREEMKAAEEEPKKAGKRGGLRTAVVSKEINKLIEEGWMDDFKEIEEVMIELEKRAVRGVYKNSVANSLRRRVGKTLDRVKTKAGKWAYRKRSE